jgi:hypothetical protein
MLLAFCCYVISTVSLFLKVMFEMEEGGWKEEEKRKRERLLEYTKFLYILVTFPISIIFDSFY